MKENNELVSKMIDMGIALSSLQWMMAQGELTEDQVTEVAYLWDRLLCTPLPRALKNQTIINRAFSVLEDYAKEQGV